MRILFFLLFSNILWSLGAQARPEILVPERVEISQREILKLGDIAILRGGSVDLLSALDKITLRQDARELLLSQELKSQEILNLLKNAMVDNEALKMANPIFKIPTQVHIEFSANPVSRDEVERKILNFLKVRCADCEYKISIQSTPITSHKGWEMDFSQFSPRGGFLLPVREGATGGTKWISGTIQVSRLTPVTTRMVLQGERLQAQDIRMEMSDVTFAKDVVLRLEDIQGQIAIRNLAVGSPIWSSELKREPAVQKGQIVKANLIEEGFELSVSMQAEDSGLVGDTIKVKNLDTKKNLSGLVIDKGMVKLQ